MVFGSRVRDDFSIGNKVRGTARARHAPPREEARDAGLLVLDGNDPVSLGLPVSRASRFRSPTRVPAGRSAAQRL